MTEAAAPSREEELLRQQDVLARFGELAVRSPDLNEILREACRLVGEALGTEMSKVMELQEDGRTLLVKAGVGWPPGVVGKVTVEASEHSSEGYALRTGQPVISPDIDTETRFIYADFVKHAGVKALVNVIIIGVEDQPAYGLLQVDSLKPREFSEHDTKFLRGYANLIAAAVNRLRATEELHKSAARLEVLVAELQHRSRNLLGVIAAIASRILRRGGSVEGFEIRLQALSRAQGLLSQSGSDTVELGEIIRTELAAYTDLKVANADISGPKVRLTARQVQNFTLAIHELTTNAVKYGALRDGVGRLIVSWTVDRKDGEDPYLVLTWTESGVSVPAENIVKRGYGRELIERALAYALRARTEYQLGEDGVRCTIALPLSDV